MLYQIETGTHYEHYTFGFIEGPVGFATAIEEAIRKFSEASIKHSEKVSEATNLATAAFYFEHGPGPNPIKTFGELHPEHESVMSVGKKHHLYPEAKAALTSFLSAQTQRQVAMQEYMGKCHDYIAKQIAGILEDAIPKLPDFLPAGCRWAPDAVEHIHVNYIPA